MKSIVCVNTQIPTVDVDLDYDSDGSLRDYDIVVFDPTFPYVDRIQFTGGGSCISIEGTSRLTRAMSHWLRELKDALVAGKTVFVVLNARKDESAATGSVMTAKNSRNYQTTVISNYGAVPFNLNVRNARGKNVIVKDSIFKSMYDSVKEITDYRVIFEATDSIKPSFAAKDGTCVGGLVKSPDWLGNLVFIPHFDFESDESFIEEDSDWSQKALTVSHAFVSQLVSVDRALRKGAELSPPPIWVSSFEGPEIIKSIDASIGGIDAEISELTQRKSLEEERRNQAIEYYHLLYETGKPLERAIERVLMLLGYKVETLRIGDLEIDHVFVGPNGFRMIGESEGKDSSAIDISKFRQLESNIGEDFERDEIQQPAKGILFGNGYRLTIPESRPEQFTSKSLTNAKRLGSALVRTSDLYAVAIHLLDHPADDEFRASCRLAIESTVGGIVHFPSAC